MFRATSCSSSGRQILLTFRHRASCIEDRRFATLLRTLFIYLINKYISLSDICLTVHHWYKKYRKPSRCNSNGLLIIPVSSTCFGQLLCPSSGTLDCVTACGIMHPRCCRPPAGNIVVPATGRQHRWCIIPQAVTHSLVFLKMGKIIARNMLSWLELLISRYCCI